jgi:hypothetical protein
MKSMWNVVSFLAVVNLLALTIVGIWLWKSHRLDGARLADIRELLAVPVHAAQGEHTQSLREIEQQRLLEAEQMRKDRPPTDSASQIQRTILIATQEDQARRRLADERRTLLDELALATANVDEERAQFEREREAWDNAVRGDRTQKSDEQFMQAVRQYEQAPPKQGKRMIMELVMMGQVEQAVAYLDAMNARAAGKILKEFKTDEEIKLATELLEKLRTFGSKPSEQGVPATTSASNAATANHPDRQPAAGST